MTSSARISTPIYLDPSKGRYCGSCKHCEIIDPYVPSRTANCMKHDTTTKINQVTSCKDYEPIEEYHLLNLEEK